MNKLKIFFLSIILGLSGIVTLNSSKIGHLDENTMIQNPPRMALNLPTEKETYIDDKPISDIISASVAEPEVKSSSRTTISILCSPYDTTDIPIIGTDPDGICTQDFLNIETEIIDLDNTKKAIKFTIPIQFASVKKEVNAKFVFYTSSDLKNKLDYNSNLSITVIPIETVSDIAKNILTSTPVLIFIISIAASVVAKAGIKIFRFGVNYKSNFATVEQQQNFENSIRNEMRNTKSEIQDNLLKICLREISRETKPVKELQEIAENMKADRQLLDVKLDAIDEKYNEIKHMTESYNRLEAKVNRIQYGESTQDVRRVGK